MHFFPLAQANEYTFKHITSANGLPQNYVRSVIQDSRGFMWFTTFDGIVRYDGYSFKTYRRYDNGLDTGLMLYVTEDAAGNLWVGTEMGLYCYDIDTDQFTRISSYFPKDFGIQRAILKIKAVGEDQIWVYTGKGGIYRIDVIDKKNNKYQLKQYLSSYYYFPSLCIPFNGYYLTVAEGKVYAFDKVRNTFERFQEDILEDVDQIFVHKQQLYLLKKGLAYLYNEKTSTLFQLTNHPGRELFISSDNQLWVSSFDGLYRTSLKGLTPERAMETVFSGNPWTTSFTEDSFGNIWIGTYRNGTFCFHKNQTPFQKSMSGKNIECMSTDHSGNYWIGSLNGEVCVLDSTQKQIMGKTIFPNDMIHTIYGQESSNKVWVGTMHGLYEAWIESNKQIVYQKTPGINIPSIRSIVQDSCFLWIASYNNGVTLYNYSTQQSVVTYKTDSEVLPLPSNTIRTILKDRENNLWVGTAEGLVVLNGKERFTSSPIFRKFSFATHQNNLLFQDNIVHIREAKNGDIWVGTLDNGLYYLKRNPSTNDWNYQWINVQKGLSNNCIKAISEDNNSFIWVATNKGLNRIDPQTLSVKIYQLNDGLANNEFSERAYIEKRNGTLYFGGINGITSFTPAVFTEDTILPKLSFVNLSINNKTLKVGEEVNRQILLERSILNTDKLTLSSRNNNFSFDFVALHFTSTDKIIYKYKLEGFDKDWMSAGYRKAITYTNLNPGEYKLKIKSSEEYSGKESICKEIDIIVKPPFYKSTWAYCIYVAIIIISVYLVVSFYSSKLKLRASLEYEKKEKKQIEELNQSKLRFFTNISHEFRTPLTLIVSQLEMLMERSDIQPLVYSKLVNIHRNTLRMKRLITELLDFRKQEQGFEKFKYSKQDIYAFLDEIYLSFKEYARGKQINLEFLNKDKNLEVWFDVVQLEKVIYNLLSNAFKYTPLGGTISLSVQEYENSVVVTVSDTGVGIAEESLDKIFDRFYQVDSMNNQKGTGIGLALAKSIIEAHKGKISVRSMEGKGTTFVVELPLGDSHITDAQKIATPDIDSSCISELTVYGSQVPADVVDDENVDNQSDETRSKILIVEDNEELRGLLARLFSKIYTVYEAQDGEEGFEKTKEVQPDIVLSDIMMPKMSGIEMCRKIKSNFETSHIPVILLTAQTAEEYTMQGLKMGADDYVTKPFNVKHLFMRCNNLVNSRKLLQQKYAKQMDNNVDILATNSADYQFMEQCVACVEQNLDNPDFDVNMFAQAMNTGRTKLFLKVKGITGQTPNDFILNIRLKKAQMLLKQMDTKTVSEIAYEVGFNSPSYFIKRFRELFGVTPAQYQKGEE